MIEEQLAPEGYEISIDLTTTAAKANIVAIVMALPLMLVFIFLFYFIHGQVIEMSVIDLLRDHALVTLGVIVLGIIGHELLHGIGWALYANKGFKSIRFGIIWHALTPYCHCNEPLKLPAYLFGGILPALVLGITPSLVALLIGHQMLLIFGLFFILAAGGDFLVAWMLRKQTKNQWVQDHPSKIGCVILDKISE